MSNTTGWEPVTRSSLMVKDRMVLPPDRPFFYYHVIEDEKVVQVEGGWGDFLRDVDKGLVVMMKISHRAPMNEAENTEGAMLITDLFPEGIPDRAFISDPMLPY